MAGTSSSRLFTSWTAAAIRRRFRCEWYWRDIKMDAEKVLKRLVRIGTVTDIDNAKRKAQRDAAKATIRAEDMAKGIYTTVSQLPKQEPHKATLSASAAV